MRKTEGGRTQLTHKWYTKFIMSRIEKIRVTCPKCKTEGDFTYYHSITLGDGHKSLNDFEFGAYGISLELLAYRCESCGEESAAVHDLLINDLDNNRMIQLSVEGNDEAIEDSRRQYQKMFGKSAEFIVIHSPLDIPPLFGEPRP